MARAGLDGRKGGQSECRVCAHPGRKEIEVQILNDVPYKTIVASAKRLYPSEPELNPSVISRHKSKHLLNAPITRTVENEDGTTEVQTYLTGHYQAQNIVIDENLVPKIPSISKVLQLIIACGLHNALNNPGLVSPRDLLKAVELLKTLGGGSGELDELLGSWGAVEKEKKEMGKNAKTTRRTHTRVEETTEIETTHTTSEPGPQAGEVVDGEWSVEDLNTIAIPEKVQ